MSKYVHVVIQLLAMAAQALNMGTGMIHNADWRVLVAAAIGLIQAVVAIYNHGAGKLNPVAVANKVRGAAAMVLLLLLAAATSRAQTPKPPAQTATSAQGSFSLNAQAVALPGGGQTVAGTLVGFTKTITPTISLRNDDLLAPSDGLQGYFGGVQWFPSNKFLAKTSLSSVQPYVTGSVGIDRIVPATGPSQQHIAFLIGGGLNYTPSSGPTINLVEVRYARLPGVANNTAVVSSGFTLSF